jgi:hypothetical protein
MTEVEFLKDRPDEALSIWGRTVAVSPLDDFSKPGCYRLSVDIPFIQWKVEEAHAMFTVGPTRAPPLLTIKVGEIFGVGYGATERALIDDVCGHFIL